MTFGTIPPEGGTLSSALMRTSFANLVASVINEDPYAYAHFLREMIYFATRGDGTYLDPPEEEPNHWRNRPFSGMFQPRIGASRSIETYLPSNNSSAVGNNRETGRQNDNEENDIDDLKDIAEI